jgi:hypothetical protein
LADEEVVRKLTITATNSGFDDTTNKANALADSISNVAEVTDTSSRKALSAQAAYDKQTNSVVDGAAAHAKYTSAVKVATNELNQGGISQDQYAARLKLLKEKYGETAEKAGTFTKAIDGIKERLSEFESKAGVTGQVLSSFGAAGAAAAIGVGILYEAFSKLGELATEQGQWARQLTQTAETLNLTTTQLQALNEVASQTGVSNETLSTSLNRMQVQLSQLTQGGGTLFDALSKGNKTLRDQLSVTKDSAEQINILARAYANASTEQQKLITRGLGRNGQGAQIGRVLTGINSAGGVEGAVAANAQDNIATDQIKKWDELSKAIAGATEAASHNFGSIFTTQILTSQKEWAERWLEVSRWAKEFFLSDDLKKILDWVPSPATLLGLAKMVPGPVGMATRLGSSAYDAASSIKPGSLTHSRDFDSTFATNFNPGNLQRTPEGPTAPDNITPSLGVQAADAAKLVTQLGAAATAQDKYTAARLAAVAASSGGEATMTKDIAARVIENAGLERSTALHAAHNSALGGAATVEDVLAAKHDQLNKLQQQGANLTPRQIAAQLALTRAQTDGTQSIDVQTAAEKVKIATVGMSEQAALAYSTAQNEINRQLAAGRSLADINVVGIINSANAYASAATKAKTFKEAFDFAKSSVSGFATDLIHGLTQGKSLMESLSAAATNLATKVLDASINKLIDLGGNALMGAASGAGSGAALTTGATSAAAIMQAGIAAGVTTLVTGATTAAAILAGGGAEAGVGVDVGTSLGGAALVTAGGVTGTTLVTAGVATGAAINGPVLALIGAIVAATALVFLGGSNHKQDEADARARQAVTDRNQRIDDATTRSGSYDRDALTVGIDQSTLKGQLQAFDQQASWQRLDELKKGNGAVLALERDLAAQRQSIIEKANKAIEKSLEDFLESIKTGSSSILSPGDQLAYEQSLFNKQLAGAQGGNEDDLNSITKTASTLLGLAQAYYASGVGYADIYKSVVDSITGLESSSLNTSTLAANTNLTPVNASDIGHTAGYADGGYVGNGTYGRDSVMATYAGGGNIALAGGEHVTRANSVNAATRPALDYINRTGKADNNGEVARILTQGFNGQTQVLSDRLDEVIASVKRLESTTKQSSNQRRVPGTDKA